MSETLETIEIRVIDARHPPSLLSKLAELWHFRELIVFLAWRDIKSRYKSASLGILWVVVQPLVTAVTVSLCLARSGTIPTDTIPYPLFALSGLIIWQYVATVVGNALGGAASISQLINKVYFPKAVIPLTVSLVPLFDLAISMSLLLIVLTVTGNLSANRLIFLFPFVFLTYLTALGAGIWFCALSLRFHDFRHLTGLITQIWMFGSPVFYSTGKMQAANQMILSVNPLNSSLSGFRWALFKQAIEPQFQLISWVSAIFLILTGAYVLHVLSATLADNV